MEENNKKKPSVMPLKNGPYMVEGLTDFQNSKAEKIETTEIMNLCRCGSSNNKPFCDRTHVKIGFKDEKEEDRIPEHTDRYVGKDIIIHDNRGVCAHRGNCTKYSPKVFGVGSPWIDPNGEESEDSASTIKKCPSGALGYTKDGILHKDFEEMERDPGIAVSKNGPYDVVGWIEFKDEQGNIPESKEHYTLCRCGASKNKPFCDGAHKKIKFVDDKN